ncbi:MAG: sigma-70 family RNA polymerase sigma factor [Acidobacteria bacterium]|nr:sigma-70 family RNA polymerase sigma factor [Acidobacteriota bacterium]
MISSIETAQITRSSPLPSEHWVDEHGDYLYRFAMSRLHDRAAAEDAVQETLLAALRSQQRFSNNSTERTWLTGILKHKIADQWRSMFRTVPFSNFSPLDDADTSFFRADGHWAREFASKDLSADQAASLDSKEFARSVRAALAVIPKRLAIVFTLREIEGMDTSEMCELLNITRENLFVMLHRARLHLREALSTNRSV